ncbi:helix-turn-helix domain-containing protein [Roseiflexus sp.]|uniref:nSTAND1 domain-containing NTPase n=1 Tax=Roseiflexus sp. TaxID=2562120 RepID=UPI00398ACABB
MPDDTFVRALKERRRALDLTQAELARRAGCALITLKRVESGSLRPSRELAEHLLRALDVAPADREQLIRHIRRPRGVANPRNPFKGLRAFTEADASDFFGCEALVSRLLTRLAHVDQPHEYELARSVGAPPGSSIAGGESAQRTLRMLALVGPSGSGKSSVVHAGLLPAIRRGALPGSQDWPVALLTPGTHPVAALETALQQSRASVPGLVVIDQFEEAWTLCQQEAECATFLERLLALAQAPGGPFVVVTLRADFYDRPLQYRAFGAALRQCTEVVLPLGPEEIVDAITGPLEHLGMTVEPELIATLVAESERRPGALPLLQYTLTELFERRAGTVLNLASYRAIGGIAGALTHRADELYLSLDDAARAAARQLFLRLVHIGETAETTRRRAYEAELPTGAHAIAELFANHRLLTLDRDAGGATVELAHEALIDGWQRLSAWVNDQRADLRIHRGLAHAASEWHAAGADPSFLASGARLAQFEALSAIELNHQERAFLAASVAERERRTAQEQARQEALRESLARSEAQRLAAEANRLIQRGGSAELIALLALHSLALRYTPQGDEALCGALLLDLPVRHFTAQTGRVYCVAYAPDGRTVLTGGQDTTIRAWDVATGSEVRQFTGHTSNLHTLAFSPDGRLIASGSDDGTVRIWEASSGALLHLLPHGAGVQEVAFTADGRLLTCSLGSHLQLWDPVSGALLETLDTGVEMPGGASLSPDGRSCIYCTGSSVLRWTFGEPSPVMLLRDIPRTEKVVCTLDDRMILAGTNADFITRRLDIETGSVVCDYRGHTDFIAHFSVTPDGAGVLTSSLDSTTRLWDIQTGIEVRRFAGHNNLIWSHACAPDGRFVLTGGLDGVATLWSLDHIPDPPVLRGSPAGLITAVFTPDGRTVVTVGDDRALRVWDTATGRERHCWRVTPEQTLHGGLAAHPWGRHVAVACNDGVGRIVEIETGAIELLLAGHHRRIWGIAVSPDGRLILTTGSDRTARLWDATTGDMIHLLTGHTDLVVGASFSPDGRYAVTGSDDRTVRLWDSTTGAEVQRLVDPRFPMVYAAVSPDMTRVLTGSADGSVRCWDLAHGREIWRTAGHHGYINSAQISADGTLGLTAAQDRTARLWNMATGEELRRFTWHTGAVYGASFAPDGRHILTCSSDGTARIWHLDWRDAAEHLRSRLLRDFTEDERTQYGIRDLTGSVR